MYRVRLINSILSAKKSKYSLSTQLRKTSTQTEIDYLNQEKRIGIFRESLAQSASCIFYWEAQCINSVIINAYLRINRIHYDSRWWTSGRNSYKEIGISFPPSVTIQDQTIIDSRCILSFIESYLLMGLSIKDLITLYDYGLSDNHKLATVHNPYFIFDTIEKTPSLINYRNREEKARKMINEQLMPLVKDNILYSFSDAYHSLNIGHFGDEKTELLYFVQKLDHVKNCILSPIKNSISKNSKKDVKIKFNEIIESWLKDIGEYDFHGGKIFNVADIEMYGIMKYIKPYPLFQRILTKYPKFQDWFNRIDAFDKDVCFT